MQNITVYLGCLLRTIAFLSIVSIPLYLLISRPLWIDEVATIAQLESSLFDSCSNMMRGMHSSWFYTPLIWLLYPQSEETLYIYRIPSVLSLFVAAYLFYLIIKYEFKDPSFAKFCAHYLVLLSPALLCSIDVRAYMLEMVLLLMLFLLVSKQTLLDSLAHQIAYGLISGLILWLHIAFAPSVLALGVVMMWQQYEHWNSRSYKNIITIVLSSMIVLFPLLQIAYDEASMRNESIGISKFVSYPYLNNFIWYVSIGHILVLLSTLLFYIVTRIAQNQSIFTMPNTTLKYSITWLLGTALILVLVEVGVGKNLFYDRHTLQLVPAAIIAFFVTYRELSSWWRYTLLVLICLSNYQYTRMQVLAVDQYTAAPYLKLVRETISPHDVVLYSPPCTESFGRESMRSDRYLKVFGALPKLYNLPGEYSFIPTRYHSYDEFVDVLSPLIEKGLANNKYIFLSFFNREAQQYLTRLAEGKFNVEPIGQLNTSLFYLVRVS